MSEVTRHSREARRNALRRLLTSGALLFGARAAAATPVADTPRPERRWFEAAVAMKRLAESWGDQSYGAVLILGDALAGEGPSRVVKDRDPAAHAERVAIRDAQQRLGRTTLAGSILYSTSRPCRDCEAAAARAQVSRMIYGSDLRDAGVPRP